MAMKEHAAISVSGGFAILVGLALLLGVPGCLFAQIRRTSRTRRRT